MPEEGSGPHLPMTSAGETGRYRADLAHQGVMAPAWLDVVPPQVFFGYSGHVQMPRAANGISVIPDHPGMAGELTTIERQQNGRLVFDGRIEDTRDGIPQDEYDPTETYVWLRNWKYLLPFPPAPSLSRFTYQFEVEVYASLFNDLDNASFMSFDSVGEEADFTPGSQIPVSTDAGWPLIADLGVPDTVSGFYNGNYGYLTGASTVQRTFSVRAGKTPAIAVIVGAIGIIGMLGRTTYAFGGTGYSSMTPRSKDGIVGRVDFLYEPLGELAPQ